MSSLLAVGSSKKASLVKSPVTSRRDRGNPGGSGGKMGLFALLALKLDILDDRY